MEVSRSLVDAEQFVDVVDNFRFEPEILVHGCLTRSEREGGQQVEVGSTVHRVFAVEPFCYLRI